jgi:hypothetical protein
MQAALHPLPPRPAYFMQIPPQWETGMPAAKFATPAWLALALPLMAAVRSQLSAPGWSRLVQTRDRDENEAVDVYLSMDNHTITGVAIIVSDPRKFTIVNVVGSVDVDQIARLRQTFEPGGPMGQPQDRHQ